MSVSIAHLIVLVEDFTAFSLVCRAWRFAAAKENFTGRLEHQVPLMLLYPNNPIDKNIEAKNFGEFYNLRKRKIHSLSLAEAKRNEVHFSSLGWLITVSKDFRVSLLHHLRHHPRVKLPSFRKYKHYGDEDYRIREELVDLQKLALSSSPFVHIGLCSHGYLQLEQIAFCGQEDDAWTIIDERNVNHTYFDVTYYRGHFYFEDGCGRILVCDIEDPEQARITVITRQMIPLKPGHFLMNYFLVESRGVLSVVQHVVINKDGFEDTEFRVFEVPFNNGNWLDSEVTNLGSRT